MPTKSHRPNEVAKPNLLALERAAMPLQKWLRRHGDPHQKVIVDQQRITVIREEAMMIDRDESWSDLPNTPAVPKCDICNQPYVGKHRDPVSNKPRHPKCVTF